MNGDVGTIKIKCSFYMFSATRGETMRTGRGKWGNETDLPLSWRVGEGK